MLTASVPLWVRAAPLGPLGAGAVLAASPVVVAELLGDRDLHGALIASTVLAAASLAYAVEDDAAVVLASSPSTLARRRSTQLGVALAIVAVGWAVAAVLAADDGPVLTRQLGVIASAASGLALAVASTAARRDHALAAFAGAVGAVTILLVVSAGAVWYPWLPSLEDPSAWWRWIAIAGLAWAVAAWETRDPATRSPRSRP